MKLKIGLLAVALLIFLAAMVTHLVGLFILSPEVAQQSDWMLYGLLASLLYLAVMTYAAMSDGVIFVGNIGCLMTLFGGIMRTPPYMMQALGMFLVYGLLYMGVISPGFDNPPLSGAALLIAAVHLVSMALMIGRLDAEDRDWYKSLTSSKDKKRLPK